MKKPKCEKLTSYNCGNTGLDNSEAKGRTKT
jgi:hypothetical protein